MISEVMDHKLVFVFLVLLLTSESLTQEIQAKLPVETPCRGKSCLLPANPPANHTARNFPWGSGIRVGVHYRSDCDAKIDSRRLLKAVIEHVGPFKCVVLPPGNFTLVGFQKGIIDVYINEYWKIPSRSPSLYPHRQDNMCVVIKRKEPQRQTIIQTFTRFAWEAVFASVLSFSVVLRFTGNRGVILETFRTFISGAFTENKKRSIANGLSLLLSAFGVIMITAFSANFMSFLAVSKEPVQPQTLEEVNDRVSTVYGDPLLKQRKEILCHSDDALCRSGGLIDKIIKNWDFSTGFPLDTAFISSQTLYEWFRRCPEWVDGHTGRSLTHLVPQCVLAPGYLVFAVRDDWPDADRLSYMLQKAIEAGINHKMRSDHIQIFIRIGWVLPEMVPSTEPQPLALSILLEPVIVLCGGTALATAAFLAELIMHNLWIKLKRKLLNIIRCFLIGATR